MSSCRGLVLLSVVGLVFLSVSDLSAEVPAIRFDRLSITEGLSQNTVTAILQDEVGFMWFGTQEGLNRYDGRRFVIYERESSDPWSLPDNSIHALENDPSGDIWIGTDRGLARWHRANDTFSTYLNEVAPRSAARSVRALLSDREGLLWIGTDHGGLARLDPATGTFEWFRHRDEEPTSLANDHIRALHEDSAGHLWVGTLGGLDLFDPSSRGFHHFRHDGHDGDSLSDDQVRSILEDSTGTLWIGTFGGGVNRFDRATRTFVTYRHDPSRPETLSGDRVRALWEDHEGRLWVGTDDGLSLYLRQEDHFAAFHHRPTDPNSLSQDRVVTIYQDRSHVFWVGTQDGLNRWNPQTWTFRQYMSPTHLSGNSILAFAEGSDHELWVGTMNGLNRLERDRGTFRVFRHDPEDPGSLSDDRVTALLLDRGGDLWAGTMAGGLNRFDAAGAAFERFASDSTNPHSLSSDAVVTLLEDRHGTLWIGTYGGGLDRFDRDSGTFEHLRPDSSDPRSLSDGRVMCLAEDPFGWIWIGTKRGLHRLHPTRRRVDRFRQDPARPGALRHDDVSALYFDRSQRILWIGTGGGGLHALDHPESAEEELEFVHYSRRHGLPGDVVNGILADATGLLWISTNRGLTRFDPQNETFETFNVSHGLRSEDFTRNAAYANPRGELFFGTFKGFNSFFADRVGFNQHVPPVVLTSYTKLNEEVHLERPIFDVDEVVLSHRDSFFSFEFAALDFTAPRRNRYRYRLDGFNDDWVEIGHRNEVTFTNLDPGHYTLRVQGSNNDGVWNQQGAALGIYIRPPFWHTWWFRSVAALVVVLLGMLLHEVRVLRVRRNNQRLRRLVEERTGELRDAQDRLLRKERLAVLGELAGSVAHELRNPLGAIKNSVVYLQLTQQQVDAKAKKHLERMERDIERSDSIITDLLDYARATSVEKRRVSLGEVLDTALRHLDIPAGVSVVAPQDCSLEIEADPRHVRHILDNLLTNAVQAMPGGGRLEVECGCRNGEVRIVVIDTGEGVAPENLAKIFEPLFTTKVYGIGLGLALSQRYARLNKGDIEIRSELGHGASFELRLPLWQPPSQVGELGWIEKKDEPMPTVGSTMSRG